MEKALSQGYWAPMRDSQRVAAHILPTAAVGVGSVVNSETGKRGTA